MERALRLKPNAFFNTLNANPVTIALDGTGGDNRQDHSVVKAVSFALNMCHQLHIMVFGPKSLEQELKKSNLDLERVSFRLAPQSIPQDESPRKVIEEYEQSAMKKGLYAVKNGEALAFVSGGGTGPLVSLSRHILGTISDFRPALAAKIPSRKGSFSVMLDLGANATSNAQDLYGFALLGKAYAELCLNVVNPKVAILNVGSERNKGSKTIRDVRYLLESDINVNLKGYIEANKIFSGDADVIVTDGFTGNVALKSAEGVAYIFTHGDGLKKFFAKLAWPNWLTPWQYNGSPLLGVKGIVIKSHASAKDEALACAIVEAVNAVKVSLASSIEQKLSYKK